MPAQSVLKKELEGMSRLKIALSELESSDADLFRASLARLITRLTQHWEWADLARADLVIVDMDSLFGHMAWLKAHGAGKRVITFARSGTVHGSDLVLGKPLDDDAFAAVLEQVAVEFDADPASPPVISDESFTKQPIAEISSPRFGPGSLQLEPQDTASVAVREAPAHVMQLDAAGDMHPTPEPAPAVVPAPPPEPEPEPESESESESESEPVNIAEILVRRPPVVAIEVAGGELVIDPERDAYYACSALKPLQAALTREPSALQSIEAVKLGSAREGKAQPLARLRWYAGLIATPGVLSWGLRDDERYKLSRWPQTEREFPRHFRIATAMMKDAATPADLADASNVPIDEVNDYINASRAAGWLEIQRDEPPPPEPEESAQRGALLSRFRKPFGR